MQSPNYSLIILISNQIYIVQCGTLGKIQHKEYSILGFKKMHVMHVCKLQCHLF